MLNKPKNRQIAAVLAFAGVIVPIAGLHKLYLGQYRWGMLYLLLSLATPIPKIASAIEGVWYLSQDSDQFDRNFNDGIAASPTVRYPTGPTVDPAKVSAITTAVRQLDQLRQDGLISEYEFEQKRRQLLDSVT
ncbi:SHOCT domain-containing protein [Trichocoleus desertorum AS-A10]|uniref:SHOCT domain-containing protein n=1 Tax=Trichocoleus desertorum TaxID=1481672 RepID=UPI003298ED26